jgi:hypothetical protein
MLRRDIVHAINGLQNELRIMDARKFYGKHVADSTTGNCAKCFALYEEIEDGGKPNCEERKPLNKKSGT